jgi:hypothetical protein
MASLDPINRSFPKRRKDRHHSRLLGFHMGLFARFLVPSSTAVPGELRSHRLHSVALRPFARDPAKDRPAGEQFVVEELTEALTDRVRHGIIGRFIFRL